MSAGSETALNPEQSSADLSMTILVDAYINVLLCTVLDEIKLHSRLQKDPSKMTAPGIATPQNNDTTSPVSKEIDVVRFVDKIITQSVAVVLSQQEHFINGMVCEVLDKVSKEDVYDGGFDLYGNKLDKFAREFAHDIIQNEKIAKTAISDTLTSKSTTSTSTITKNKTKRDQIPSRKSKSSDVFKAGHDAVSNYRPGDVIARRDVDYVYVHNRLMTILKQKVKSSVAPCVMNARPERGIWREQSDVMDEQIKTLEHKFKNEHPITREFMDKSEIIAEDKKEAKGVMESSHHSETSQAGEDNTIKISKSTSRTRRILMRMRSSLGNLKNPFRN